MHPAQTSVENATKATQDSDGNIIVDTYATKEEVETVDNKIPGINSRVEDLEERLPLVENPVATGSTVARSLQDRFADVVNVKDFGAVGDGITDDYDAFHNACAYLRQNGGGTLFVPRGRYVLSSPLWLTRENNPEWGPISIEGAGIAKFPGGV